MTTIPGQVRRIESVLAVVLVSVLHPMEMSRAEPLLAGAARIDITSPTAGPAHGRLHARALVLQDEDTTAVVVTLDVVAIGEIGHIGNDFLPAVRARVSDVLGIQPQNILVNASHCHGVPCDDVADKTVQAIVEAAGKLVPVRAGVGHGHEDRIMENRRLKLNDGREIDVRHAYSMPRDEDVVAVGPIDPEIGVLRLDREDGSVLAVVYNFACHPIQGVPGGVNTSDITGFASQVIEDNLDQDTVALFVQGCGGDINPVFYKDVSLPRNAEPLGQTLGLSTLKAIRAISTDHSAVLRVLNESIELPRADLAARITAMEAGKERLLRSLGGTTLNLKAFLPLVVRYRLDDNFPSYYSHSYLNERQLGRNHLERLDDENRRAIDQYIRNIHTMEQLTRLQTNQRLLEKHQAHYVAGGRRTVDAEVAGIRVGEFRLVTFPGELTVQIGLNLKSASPFEHTFIAGYTNGYLYYSPTAEQLRNVGNAQEDSDCLLAPEWQAIFEQKALDVLTSLGE